MTLVVVATIMLVSTDALAQCPMCRSAAESNMKNGGVIGSGLNVGILYMLCMPYLLVATLGLLWWRNQRRKKMLDMDGG